MTGSSTMPCPPGSKVGVRVAAAGRGGRPGLSRSQRGLGRRGDQDILRPCRGASPWRSTSHVTLVVGQPLRIEVEDDLGRSGSAEGDRRGARAHQGRDRRGGRRARRAARRHSVHGGRRGPRPLAERRRRVLGAASMSPRCAARLRERRPRTVGGATRTSCRGSRAPASCSASGRVRRSRLVVRRRRRIASAEACLAAGADCARSSQQCTRCRSRAADRRRPRAPEHRRTIARSPRQSCRGRRHRAGAWSRAIWAWLRRRRAMRARASKRLGAQRAQSAADRAAGELGRGFAGSRRSCPGARLPRSPPASPLPVGVAVFGRQELMVTEHCILMAEGSALGRCGTCARRAERSDPARSEGLRVPRRDGR